MSLGYADPMYTIVAGWSIFTAMLLIVAKRTDRRAANSFDWHAANPGNLVRCLDKALRRSALRLMYDKPSPGIPGGCAAGTANAYERRQNLLKNSGLELLVVDNEGALLPSMVRTSTASTVSASPRDTRALSDSHGWRAT